MPNTQEACGDRMSASNAQEDQNAWLCPPISNRLHVEHGPGCPRRHCPDQVRTRFARNHCEQCAIARSWAPWSTAFFRLGDAAKPQVKYFCRHRARSWFVLDEEGGKQNWVPARHLAAEYVEQYREDPEYSERQLEEWMERCRHSVTEPKQPSRFPGRFTMPG